MGLNEYTLKRSNPVKIVLPFFLKGVLLNRSNLTRSEKKKKKKKKKKFRPYSLCEVHVLEVRHVLTLSAPRQHFSSSFFFLF